MDIIEIDEIGVALQTAARQFLKIIPDAPSMAAPTGSNKTFAAAVPAAPSPAESTDGPPANISSQNPATEPPGARAPSPGSGATGASPKPEPRSSHNKTGYRSERRCRVSRPPIRYQRGSITITQQREDSSRTLAAISCLSATGTPLTTAA